MATAVNHAVLVDTDFNSARTVQLNLYQNFLLTAMKMHDYLKDLRIDPRFGHRFISGVCSRRKYTKEKALMVFLQT